MTKTNNKQKRINQDLFNMAKDSVSATDMERYEKIGKEMYGSIDYDTSQILNNPDLLLESTSYIMEALKSGLHHSYLTERECTVMKESYGEDWIKKLGFEDL